ncbi:AcrR family transcriptional regulator [Silvibacterium bohemicum]|uniref:AcrR family transcriptional regulator n=1 Tax=Silvibacterium bohemicum TaxID=1577686 RepID=A0A841JMZ1_9BACT|nr:TetR/AcrR family transcriptional regulator [Silvibacterium bohemicum]MBB6142742.1 AcrR family transcriptional regulator [Silvibacterium bohemicum]
MLQPRKTPVQVRSAASVEAILQATLQVLLAVGKERLTTTRVAQRAGVSVGTLYQYFPNKSALLQACLRRHMDGVSRAIGDICEKHKSDGLLEMGTALVFAYLDAKMRNVKESATLYAVSSDVDGAAISKASSERSRRSVAELFATAREGLTKDPEVVATVVLAALNGVARRLLEAKFPEREAEALREELIVLVHAYLRTCTASQLA